MFAKLLLLCIVAAFIASEVSSQYLYGAYPYASYAYPYASYSWGYPGYGYYWGSNKGGDAGAGAPPQGPPAGGPSGLTGNNQ